MGNEPNEDEQHIQDIVDAIDLLNKDKDFSHNDGKPHANALSQVLDTHVSASERDEAWDTLSTAAGQSCIVHLQRH